MAVSIPSEEMERKGTMAAILAADPSGVYDFPPLTPTKARRFVDGFAGAVEADLDAVSSHLGRLLEAERKLSRAYWVTLGPGQHARVDRQIAAIRAALFALSLAEFYDVYEESE